MQHRMKLKEKAATLFAAVFATVCSFAGIKYWDNPEFKAFDVGDYVQDGLVLNYDGIRNAGPTADHDPNAPTWKNLGTGGSTYDMTKGGAAANSGWGDDGYVFAGDAYFKSASKQALPEYYEIQTLVDAKASDASSIGYIYTRVFADTWNSSDTAWNGSSIAVRPTWSQTISGTTYKGSLVFNTHYYTQGRPLVPSTVTTYDYIIAIGDSKAAALFTGLEVPTAMPGRASPQSDSWNVRNASYVYLGGHDNGSGVGEALTGTVKSFRYYSRILSKEERAWNRVVDEARYFGRVAALPVTLPVTNVVESFSIPGSRDFHYAIDAEGHTFTVPSQRTFEGKRYVLGGYTLDTWNGSAWVEDGEGTHTGNSVTVSDTTAKVRVTWQYSRPAGEGQLAHYDVGDYVTDGLMLFYDGIRNQGANASHSYDATTWVNLGNGSGDSQDWTLAIKHKVTSGDIGYWADDGYEFKGFSDFQKMGNSFTIPVTHTIQTLIDASIDEQHWTSAQAYVYATAWDMSSLALRTNGDNPKENSFYWVTQSDGSRTYMLNSSGRYDYATAIQDGDAKTATFFAGVTPPASGGLADGFKQYDSALNSASVANIFLGGMNSNTDMFTGKLKFFRYYPNKALSDDEVAKNRKVDEYRYFGRYVVTNVLVQSTYSYLEGYDKSGPYEVVDSYTFTAPETVTAPNGITYACDGYTVETQDGIGWAALTSGTGNSYLYNTSAGTVRLTWKWKPVEGVRTAADYTLEDLSPAGLALHYDGLLNQGVDAARSTTATKWINLGSAGSSMNLSTQRKSGDTSAWGDKGYEYAGYTYFQSEVNTYVWGGSYSAQILADAKHADNTHASGNYLAASSWNRFGMQDFGYSKLARSNVQGTGNDAMRVTYPTEDGIDYMTVIADAAAKVDYAFAGTKIPTGGAATAGYRPYETQLEPYSNYFRLGGWGGGNNGQGLTGTIFTFRYYDRVLTEEELVRNRNVDSVRYFGALAVTNVLVTTKYADVAGDEEVLTEAAGAYKVEGRWTFTATKVKGDKGNLKNVAGYYTEELVNGAWTNKAWHEGASYTYQEGVDAATVRLTWSGPRPGMMLFVR